MGACSHKIFQVGQTLYLHSSPFTNSFYCIIFHFHITILKLCLWKISDMSMLSYSDKILVHVAFFGVGKCRLRPMPAGTRALNRAKKSCPGIVCTVKLRIKVPQLLSLQITLSPGIYAGPGFNLKFYGIWKACRVVFNRLVLVARSKVCQILTSPVYTSNS